VPSQTIQAETADLCIQFEPYQRRFFTSAKRFPCFAAGWGTGKTMCGLFKGLLLSRAYRNNLGLVVRKVYKDLHDSTMQDFERYTGLSVPQSTAEVEFPNGSKILFRHGGNLSGLQNINLGWFYIEQAEEFESSDEFNMLRGRLRRELIFDESFAVEECDEFPQLYEHLRTRQLRQGMVIANKAGHNWIWHDWLQTPQSADFELHEAKTAQNRHNLPDDFVADLDSMQYGTETAQRKWRIYVDNSWDEVDLEGAYYAKLVGDLRRRTTRSW
jgi:phage terminase large subunit